ncbi:putative oxidoreductase C736.13 [Colletotrichum liriopes]|uniref:Oxidoreductase C736.13 n=1 Tax=Colletotrichum liriopes TaxID=708192 RepID=A0AA37LYB6_9PEZI|nr:putative oxidoreductase C736.13 [Colletotrichum liriopes]
MPQFRSEDVPVPIKAEKVITELQEANPKVKNITFLNLDLASLASVKAAAAKFLQRESRLDVLINNASIMMTKAGLTKDGYELQFGTNVIGPALFTQLLLPTLRETAKINNQTRVVMLSSAAHARAPSNIYKFSEFRTEMTDLTIVPVHHGMVATNPHHASEGFFLKPFLFAAIAFATPVEKGALSQIWAAVGPDAKTGQCYGPIGKAESGSKTSQNRELLEELFAYIQTELKGHVEKIV